MQCVGWAQSTVHPTHRKEKGVNNMTENFEVTKGRIKEAAGALIDNDKLRNEGKTDQAVGKAKEAVRQAIKKVQKVALQTIDPPGHKVD
jgi:uncharacterized protein YjbJ (UPF0337 family)